MSARRNLRWTIGVSLAAGLLATLEAGAPQEASSGFTLISPLRSTSAFLIDIDGSVVHEWETDCAPAGGIYLLEDGHLLRCGREEGAPRFYGGGLGGRLQKYTWDGELVWDYRLADERRALHHDVEPLPSGNVLAIAWEHVSREEALGRGRSPDHVDEQGLWPDVVLELRPIPPDDAEIVWEWRAWDRVIQDRDPSLAAYASIPEQPGRIDVNFDHRGLPPLTATERRRRAELEAQMRALGYVGGEGEGEPPPHRGLRAPDWLHTNSVDYVPEYELLVLSSPHLNEVFVIDHSTTTEEARGSSGGRWGRGGDLLWRWGNPRNYGAGDDADRKLYYQHDASWLECSGAGELRLLLFNNGGARPGGATSSVEELVLPFDPGLGFRRERGHPYGPTAPTWTYADGHDFFSGFVSGAQRLADGRTLICEGAKGRVFEVTPCGEVVWTFENSFGDGTHPADVEGDAPARALFRALRYAPDYPGLVGRDL